MSDSPPIATLLLVEDDDLTREFLAEHLAADGYEPLAAKDLATARRLLDRHAPDLVLTDVVLPDGSGLELAREVRRADGIASRVDPATPVLVLSGRDGELDRIRGFEWGCDDYLVKPFSYPELRLRLRAVLARAGRREQAGILRVGSLRLDPSRRRVLIGEQPIELTQKEYALLLALAREPTRVFTKSELLRVVWGFRDASIVSRTVDSHACRLRRKLGVAGDEFVVNVWGVGYRLVEAPAVAVERAWAA